MPIDYSRNVYPYPVMTNDPLAAANDSYGSSNDNPFANLFGGQGASTQPVSGTPSTPSASPMPAASAGSRPPILFQC